MEKETIIALASGFVEALRKAAKSSQELADIKLLGLRKTSAGWTLERVTRPINRRAYSTMIQIPPEIADEPINTALDILNSVITIKLTLARTAIKANATRTPELRRIIASRNSSRPKPRIAKTGEK